MVALQEPTCEGALAEKLRPLPGVLVCLVQEVAQSSVLIPLFVRKKERNRDLKGLVRGTVIASGLPKLKRVESKDVLGQPLPLPGSVVFAEWGEHCLKVDTGDQDMPELGRLVPKGYALCFYGLTRPWETCVVAEDA